MLRQKFKNEIVNALSASKYFSLYDFEIIAEGKEVKIEYNIDPQYYFTFKIPIVESSLKDTYGIKRSVYLYSADIAPWHSATSESATFDGKASLLKAISKWLEILQEDLTSTPELRRLKTLEDQFAEYSSMADSLKGEYFTSEEGDTLRRKIDEYSEKMEATIDALNVHASEKEKKISDLKDEIENLKEKIEILDKRGVFKSMLGRFFQWSSKAENREMLLETGKLAKELLENSNP